MQCSKNHFNFFLLQETGAFINNIEPQKPRPNLKKYLYHIFTESICSAFSLMQVVVLQKCINFVEQQLKFSHFEVSTIPSGKLIRFFLGFYLKCLIFTLITMVFPMGFKKLTLILFTRKMTLLKKLIIGQ